MKRTALATLLYILPLSAQASHWFGSDPWTKEDTLWQTAVIVSWIGDWAQTRYIAKHPERYCEVNINGIIGSHPSNHAVNAYMLSAIITNTVIPYVLPKGLRRVWQVAVIVQEVKANQHNLALGIKYSFH